jgi:hypothetical protein
MNIYGFEILLIGIVGSAVTLTLFIYLANLAFNFLKIPALAQISQSRKIFETKALRPRNMRKKIESKPTIICSLPIHQEARQEMRLS